MEKNNRNVLILLTAVAIALAVFASFGLPLFAAPTPTITLPTPQPTDRQEQGGEEQGGGVRVEIRPDTVQSVIAVMDRPESYSRTVTTTLEGVSCTAQVWVDAGWTRSDLTLSGGKVLHTIIGEGTVWRWYDGDTSAASWPAEGSQDVESQRLPTYEDVLALDRDSITAAGYQDKNGESCIYVEVAVPELEQWERYWISVDSGLLWCAETQAGEEIVWSMTSTLPELPAASAQFRLPSGEVLHTVGEGLG